MKYVHVFLVVLFILFLITSLILALTPKAAAQDSPYSQGLSIVYNDSCSCFIYPDGSTYSLLNQIFPKVQHPTSSSNCILELLELYKEYKVECYNDSTLIRGSEIKDLSNSHIDTTYYRPEPGVWWVNYIRDIEFYHHKAPTFTDFMEWLLKRTKQ